MNKNIQLESTTQTFSSHSGLILFEESWKHLKLDKKIKKLLPKKKKKLGPTQINKFKSLVYSFLVGNDCLSDLDDLRKDILFSELTFGGLSSRTASDFLKNFGKRHIEKLQDFLIQTSFELRERCFKEDKKFIISMDSTPHEHYSKFKEGMAYNYKNMWCLDSQNAYDQFGFSYVFDLRPGNTHSGKDSEKWIHQIYKNCPDHLERWFRADSAYAKRVNYEALQNKNVNFAIVLRENIAKYVRRKNLDHLKVSRHKPTFKIGKKFFGQ
jgi:hypothetical protein